jgi:hypothetical protein
VPTLTCHLQGLAHTDIAVRARQGLAHTDIAGTIAAAGAIPPLVQLLGLGFPHRTQENAAGALLDLARDADIAATIVAAGALHALEQLVALGTQMRPNAAGALQQLARTAVVSADAIPLGPGSPAEVLGPGSPAEVQESAVGDEPLMNLAANDANAASMPVPCNHSCV